MAYRVIFFKTLTFTLFLESASSSNFKKKKYNLNSLQTTLTITSSLNQTNASYHISKHTVVLKRGRAQQAQAGQYIPEDGLPRRAHQRITAVLVQILNGPAPGLSLVQRKVLANLQPFKIQPEPHTQGTAQSGGKGGEG